jgi:hypothetical protein
MPKDRSTPGAPPQKQPAKPDPFRETVTSSSGPNLTGHADQAVAAHKGRGPVVTDGSDNPKTED